MAKTHEQTYTDEQAGGRKEGRKKKSSMGKFKSTKKGIKRNYKKKPKAVEGINNYRPRREEKAGTQF